jgi:hypothetical protein
VGWLAIHTGEKGADAIGAEHPPGRSGKGGPSPFPRTPYDFVRFALAAILLVAAGLKCHQLATSPVLGDGLLDSRWFLMATVEFELFFGLWLLADPLPKWTHRAAIACFGLFAAVSLYKALAGYDSCGCFGRMAVPPWYTFTLDAAAVLSLLCWRPVGTGSSSLVPWRAFMLRGTAVTLVWLSVGFPAAVAMGTYQPASLAEDGLILGDDNLVILEPEKWIGKRFPLLPLVKDAADRSRPDEPPLGQRLNEGDWIVVLYRHDCPECEEALPVWEELARRSAEDTTAPRVALIEVPPYDDEGSSSLSPDLPCILGRLSKEREWIVKTPVRLLIRSGRTIYIGGDTGTSHHEGMIDRGNPCGTTKWMEALS